MKRESQELKGKLQQVIELVALVKVRWHDCISCFVKLSFLYYLRTSFIKKVFPARILIEIAPLACESPADASAVLTSMLVLRQSYLFTRTIEVSLIRLAYLWTVLDLNHCHSWPIWISCLVLALL